MRLTKLILCAARVLCFPGWWREVSLRTSTQKKRDGDPLKEIEAVRRVVFVIKGGVVYKNVTKRD